MCLRRRNELQDASPGYNPLQLCRTFILFGGSPAVMRRHLPPPAFTRVGRVHAAARRLLRHQTIIEGHLQGKFHNARITGAIDLTIASIAKPRINVSEVWMIERIE